MTLNSLKLSVAAIALMGMAATSGAAFAEDESPYGTLSGTLTMQSDYRFRGISQNDREPTPEFALDWSGGEGFYAGTFLAKINWGGNDPSFENDWYLGKHTDIYGYDLNIEAIYYGYPDSHSDATASFYETVVQLSHTFDKLTVTATGAQSPEWSLKGGVGWYGGVSASYEFTDWLSMSGTFGHQFVEEAPEDYSHWDLGLTATWRAFALDVRYIDSNISKTDCQNFWMATKKACNAGVSVTVSYAIDKIL